jgi:hypothetical protein
MKMASCVAAALLGIGASEAQAADCLKGLIVGCGVGHNMPKEQKRKDAEERAPAQVH